MLGTRAGGSPSGVPAPAEMIPATPVEMACASFHEAWAVPEKPARYSRRTSREKCACVSASIAASAGVSRSSGTSLRVLYELAMIQLNRSAASRNSSSPASARPLGSIT